VTEPTAFQQQTAKRLADKIAEMLSHDYAQLVRNDIPYVKAKIIEAMQAQAEQTRLEQRDAAQQELLLRCDELASAIEQRDAAVALLRRWVDEVKDEVWWNDDLKSLFDETDDILEGQPG